MPTPRLRRGDHKQITITFHLERDLGADRRDEHTYLVPLVIHLVCTPAWVKAGGPWGKPQGVQYLVMLSPSTEILSNRIAREACEALHPLSSWMHRMREREVTRDGMEAC